MKRIFILFLCVCMPITTAYSAGNIHVGALEVHPYLSVTQTYDDNVYATSSDTKSDWITTTMPGIKLQMPFRMHKLEAEYRAVINNYWDYSSEDITDHHAAILGDFKFGNRFGMKLGDIYDRGHEPRASSGSGEIEKYDRNAANVGLSYVFADRFKAEVAYTQTYWNFTQPENSFRDRNEYLIATYLYYRFLPKTSAFVEYDFKNVIFEQKALGLDNQVHTPLLGLRWDITEMTKGIVKAGYLSKKFEAANKDTYNTWTASVELDQAFARSSLKLIGKRDVNESNAVGTTYYITTGAFAEYTHKLGNKLSAVGRLSYGEDDYSNTNGYELDRVDKTSLFGVGLKYQMREWLEFALNYNRLNRDSNIDYRDLTDNTVSLTANLVL